MEVAIAFALLALLWAVAKRRRKRSRASPPGFNIGGIPLGYPDSGIVVTGGPGYGKTHFSRSIQEQAIRQGMPVIVACAKPDEANEIREMCRRLGCLDRFVALSPGSTHRINLVKYLTEIRGGTPLTTAQFLSRLNDIASRAEGGRNGEAFWMTMFETALICAIDLCILAMGEADMELTKDALISSPGSDTKVPEYMASEAVCAKLIRQARLNAKPETTRRLKRCEEFFLTEFKQIGEKARGAVLAMVNAILGRFLLEPFYDAMCDESTLTPEIIAEKRLIVALDFDILSFETPGRLFQLAWLMLIQGFALRRDAKNAVRILLCRDECANFTHPGYDSLVQAQARSQRLIHFDLFQDFDLMEGTYGGGPKAKNESRSFWANHGVKVAFHQDHIETAEEHSKLIGDTKEIIISGGGGGQKPQDWRDELLGVQGGMHWTEQYQRILRPEFFSTLPVGVCVLHGKDGMRVVDLRRK